VEASGSIFPRARAELSLRWEAFRDAAREFLGREPRIPAGGFYSWLPLPDRGRENPVSFCLRIRDENGVIVIPGIAFGAAGNPFIRASWAGSPADICEGVRRLAPFLRS
jgi:aspartate/methionine/tyrosine aminotransferase